MSNKLGKFKKNIDGVCPNCGCSELQLRTVQKDIFQSASESEDQVVCSSCDSIVRNKNVKMRNRRASRKNRGYNEWT